MLNKTGGDLSSLLSLPYSELFRNNWAVLEHPASGNVRAVIKCATCQRRFRWNASTERKLRLKSPVLNQVQDSRITFYCFENAYVYLNF